MLASASASSRTSLTSPEFYDDEAWWALASIRAFDLTQNKEYLRTASSIFDDLVQGQKAACGGIWWNKAHAAEVAITNSLFLETAAALANRAHHLPQSNSRYTIWALKSYTWFSESNLSTSNNGLINDGLGPDCANNNGIQWTYNQGAHISALLELHTLLGLEPLLDRAHGLAHASIRNLTDARGILHDVCEPKCYPDGTQFKGVFARAVSRLHARDPRDEYAAFVHRNARSILLHDWQRGQISVNWAGPWVAPANASTLCAGMDALVAALALASGK